MQEFLLVAGIHWLAVMSPGPDFAMVIRNSLVYSRRTGLLAAVGLAIGNTLHVIYSLLGIGLIISQSILLFTIIKWLGAAYLIYIGVKSLFTKKKTDAEADLPAPERAEKDLTALQAIRMGFLTNALNPKATLFFLALFTQVIDPATPLGIKALYGLEMSTATFIWFGLVVMLLTHHRVQGFFGKAKHHIDRAFGVVLVALGIKIAFGTQK